MRSAGPKDESLVEAILLSSPLPVPLADLAERLPPGVDVTACLAKLSEDYEGRGLTLVEAAGGWTARTRPEASELCRAMLPKPQRVSKTAMETLAVIAAFQPVTRPEIERVRGVALARGTLDILMLVGWVRPGPRRASPGNPLTFVTTDAFLRHFSIASPEELPGIERMREEGLLDARPDIGFKPEPPEGQ